ncbi:MAG TPA: 16S rRNA (cytosine(1402)-N(4))-methyltransferase, partial [Methylococcaceae bacterium]|nr:16S rRNA (cytosine(1402)-N(4))-methyltransferase [Methylococcaceae bacterium]
MTFAPDIGYKQHLQLTLETQRLTKPLLTSCSHPNRSATRSFQAIRIEINQELE